MTVITRALRAFFAKRYPSPLRVWLRKRSAVMRHFDPPHEHVSTCAGCGNALTRSICLEDCYATTLAWGTKHRIGTAWIDGMPHDKWCDGTETPE